MKTCSTCFRYVEDWNDAEVKGMAPVYYYEVATYFHKPRTGVKPRALGINCPKDDELGPDHPACEYHEYRWFQNIKVWWMWHFKYSIRVWFIMHIRVPIGRLRKPVPLKWVDSFDGCADCIIPNGEPVCPHCGEMPYSDEECAFCGQRFIPELTPPVQYVG